MILNWRDFHCSTEHSETYIEYSGVQNKQKLFNGHKKNTQNKFFI